VIPNHLRLQDLSIWIHNEAPPRDPWNYVIAVRYHHEAFVELRPYMRHHHEAFVELHLGLEAPPRNLRGITSLHEAPLWTLATRFMGLRPSDEVPPWTLTTRFMELCPLNEVPLLTLTRRVMELRSIHTLSMFHQSNIEFSCIPALYQYSINQQTLIHTFSHVKLINSSP